MPPFLIDTLDIPDPIKQKLIELGRGISFERQSPKGMNGYLFFGSNLVHKQQVAVKFYYWGGQQAYHAEPRILAEIDSPNVSTILDAATIDDSWAYFVTPFYPKGDIDDELRRCSHGNLRAVNLTRDILNGLSHLHARQLVHRDLKPQNILVDDSGGGVIGDLGSVKRIPDGQDLVPASGHSLIYQPPEAAQAGEYGKHGDLYQVGMIFYQLLGGNLPYDELSWLNQRELRRYYSIPDLVERQNFATGIIRTRAIRGKVIDLRTLPPWVCDQVKRTISKACNVDPGKRYQSCSDFLGRLAKVRKKIHDWRIEDGSPTRRNGVSYRIIHAPSGKVQEIRKRKTGGWRKDNSILAQSLKDAVHEIDRKCS